MNSHSVVARALLGGVRYLSTRSPSLQDVWGSLWILMPQADYICRWFVFFPKVFVLGLLSGSLHQYLVVGQRFPLSAFEPWSMASPFKKYPGEPNGMKRSSSCPLYRAPRFSSHCSYSILHIPNALSSSKIHTSGPQVTKLPASWRKNCPVSEDYPRIWERITEPAAGH